MKDPVCIVCGAKFVQGEGFVEPHDIMCANRQYGSAFCKEREKVSDQINPSHYKQGKIESIECIKSALGQDGFEDFLRGQVLKYAYRCRHKGNYLQDVLKLDWYSNRLAVEVQAKDVGEGCSDN